MEHKSFNRIEFYQWMLILRRFEERQKPFTEPGCSKARFISISGKRRLRSEYAVFCGMTIIFSAHIAVMAIIWLKPMMSTARWRNCLAGQPAVPAGTAAVCICSTEARASWAATVLWEGGSAGKGAAFAKKFHGETSIGAAFFGDGAANQGVLHETLNMCSVLRLPYLAVCENNGVGATTLTEHVTADADRGKLAAAYNIPAKTVDGNDVEARCRGGAGSGAHIRSGKAPYRLTADLPAGTALRHHQRHQRQNNPPEMVRRKRSSAGSCAPLSGDFHGRTSPAM